MVDNGKEFAAFQKIEDATQLEIYFSDPYSSWQRGCNENTNGLLRQYFPKGTDFTTITKKQLAQVTRQINNRP
ncbi:MAG: IS30 family transposase [Gammaproteobacteria bacterium]|nr:IS30 family transposase [Gammaproteobacteria bacterium]